MHIRRISTVFIAAVVALCMVVPSFAVSVQGEAAESDGADGYGYEPKGVPVLDLPPAGSGGKGSGGQVTGGEISAEVAVGPGNEDNVLSGEYVFREGGCIHVEEGYILYFDMGNIILEGNGGIAVRFDGGASAGIIVGGMQILLKTFDGETDATLTGKGTVVFGGEGLIHLEILKGFEFRLGGFAVTASGDNTMDFTIDSFKADFGGLSVTYPSGEGTDTLTVSGNGDISMTYKTEGGRMLAGLEGEMALSASGGNFSASFEMVSDLLLAVPSEEPDSLGEYVSGSVGFSAEVSAKFDLSPGGEDPSELDVELEKLRMTASLSGDTGSETFAVSGKVSFDRFFAAIRSEGTDVMLEIRDFSIGSDARVSLDAVMGLAEYWLIPVKNPTLPVLEPPSDEIYAAVEDFASGDPSDGQVEFYLEDFAADPVSGYVDFPLLLSLPNNLYGLSDDFAVFIAKMRAVEYISLSLDIGGLDLEIGTGDASVDVEAGGISAGASISNSTGEDVTVSKVEADARAETFRLKISSADTSISRLEAGADLSLDGEVGTFVNSSDEIEVEHFVFKGSVGLSLYAKGYVDGSLFMMQVDGGEFGFDFSNKGMYANIAVEMLRMGLFGTEMSFSSVSVDTDGKLSAEEMRMSGTFLHPMGVGYGMFASCDISVKGLRSNGFGDPASSVDRVDARIELASGSTLELKSTWNSRTVSVNGGNVTRDEISTVFPFNSIITTQMGIVPEGTTLTFGGDSLYVAESFYVSEGGSVSGPFAFENLFSDQTAGYSLSNRINGGYVGVEYTRDGPSFFLVPEEGYTGTGVASPSGFAYDAGTKGMTIAAAGTVTVLSGTVEGFEQYNVHLNLGGGNVEEYVYGFMDSITKAIPATGDGRIPLFVANGFGKSVGEVTETAGSFTWSHQLKTAGDLDATVHYGEQVSVTVGENTFDADGLRFTIPSDASGTVTVRTASGVIWEIDGGANQGRTYTLFSQKTVYGGHDAYLLNCEGGRATVYLPADGSDSVLFHVNGVGLSSVAASSFVEMDGAGYLKYDEGSYSYFYAGADPYPDPSSGSAGNGIDMVLVGAAAAAIAAVGLAGAYFLHRRSASP